MTIEEKIRVMKHFADGGKVECSHKSQADWATASMPNWNWSLFEYRIKPESKMIPLGKGDITPTTYLKDCNDNLYRVVDFNGQGVTAHCSDNSVWTFTYTHLIGEDFKISTNQNKFEWRKCEKEVV